MLRTLLALSVVLDHLGGGATDWLVGGRLAVQLFYVISGFLISYVLTATDHYRGAPGRFYANRALRLYPVYLAVAALTLLAYLAGGGEAFWRVYEDLPLSAELFLALSNLVILGQDWPMFFGIEQGGLAFTGSFAHSEVPLYQGLLVPQAWTLGVEMSFYLVAPFVLHSPRRLLVLLVASLALRAALIASGIGLGDPWTYRFFPTELALFLLGSLSHQVLLPRWQPGVGALRGCRNWARRCCCCMRWPIFPLACRPPCAMASRCCCSLRCCRWPSCSSHGTGSTRRSAN
ncbi:acyltransferase family protein [Achromobacter xylosoxidans]